MEIYRSEEIRTTGVPLLLVALVLWPAVGEGGARDEGEGWWAYQPVAEVEVPGQWEGNGVDYFVERTLGEAGLEGNGRAGRRALLRRVTYDLTGLPPTADEVEAFERVEDQDIDGAYAAVVEGLLGSPRYGERWGRHWLDVVRFGESKGYEQNHLVTNLWPYRDYVIGSFNEDKPYDVLVKEHVAGDVIGPGDPTVEAGSMFLVAGPYDSVGNQDAAAAAQIRANTIDEMIRATSEAFLGTTVGCARCHDHKFDPVSQADYYRMYATFAGVKHGSRKAWDGKEWWLGMRDEVAGKAFHVFGGGSPQRVEEEVVAASLGKVGGEVRYELERGAKEGERRLALAEWLVDPQHPLTARVMANRVWQYHFGRGLVATSSDFGAMGKAPTHPELLDWLAGELVRGGWRLKRLHRLIVTSEAYRRSSAWSEVAGKVDAGSELLWRFPPRRMSAEEIRDTLLSVAGKLDLRMGGPGYRLYEYQQDNVATYVPLDAHGPETYRRAVYHHNARAAFVDGLAEFDCPDNAFSAPVRATTTTPLQALTMMNHAFTQDMARFFAERVGDGGGGEAQVRRVYRMAYGREASVEEIGMGLGLIEGHGLRALCRAVLNTNELIYLD